MDNSANMNNEIKNLKTLFFAILVFFVLIFIPNISIHAETNPPAVYTNLAADITQTSATLSGSVGPYGSPTTAWFEWGSSENGLNNETPHQNMGSGTTYIGFLAGLSGLSSNTVYYYRAVAKNDNGTSYGSTMSFKTSEVISGTTGGGTSSISGNCIPVVTTGSATFVTKDSATLRGLVNPRGRSTDAWFEYGESFALTHRLTSQHIGSGSVDTDFIRYMPNLKSNTTYYFRAVAENICGINHGSTLNFTTDKSPGDLPKIVTLQATLVTQNSAIILGEVNPKNSQTTAWFEWGRDSNLNTYSSTAILSLGSGDSFRSVSSSISLLSPNTTYYYRIVAKNNFGIVKGIILNFKTPTITVPSAPPPAPTPAPAPSPKISLSVWKETKNLSFPNGNSEINCAFAGDAIEFSLNIKNEGKGKLSNVIVRDEISPYFDFIESNPKISDESHNNSLIWKLDSLSPNETKLISFKIKVKPIQENTVISNFFTVEIDNFTQTSNKTSTVLSPDLSVASAKKESGQKRGIASALGLSWDKISPLYYIIAIIVILVLAFVLYMRHRISKMLKT